MKMLHNLRARLVLAAALLILTLGCAAFGQITPSDDAYVNSAKSTTNFGIATTLNLQSAADTSYIRFDLTAIPAGYTGASIAKATLKLYVNSVTTAGSFNVDSVNGTWAEQTITYSLQPAIGITIASSVPLTTANKGQYVEIDVTAAMVEWLNGTQPNDGIALVANSPLVATFDSKENTGASHPPEIDIVYAGIAGVSTASGSGLTGGGTSGTLNLALTNSCSTNQILQWNGSSWACATVGTGTITGVTAGGGLTGGGSSGTVTLNLDTTKVPQLNVANSFTGNQSVTGNVTATGTVSGSSFTGNGSSLTNVNAAQLGGQLPSYYATQSGFNDFTHSQAFLGNGLFMYTGDPGCGSGYAGIGFGQLSGCNNYAIAGSLTDTYLNRPSGGTLHFRENNTDEMIIYPGGAVVIAPTSSLSAGTYALESTTSTPFGVGVFGGTSGDSSTAVLGYTTGSNSVGILGSSGTGLAAEFFGQTLVSGDLTVNGAIFAGTKDFKIDHPLDPANKYLYHASVESSEMINIYTGNVTTDAQGDAVVELPEWFEALNSDFRYQLTVMGQFAQAIVANKTSGHHFGIKTDKPNVEVSWQVTGVRHDAFAQAHPLQVEVDKSEKERGHYMHPQLYGAPEEKSIEWANQPEIMKRLKEQSSKAAASAKP